MKNKKVNLEKIDKMALMTFLNVIRLHSDSILLFNNNSVASSFYLSVIALEELGKIFIITDFLFNSRVNGRFNDIDEPDLNRIFGEDLEEGYFKTFLFSHKHKQRKVVNIFDNIYKPSNKYFKDLLEGKIEIFKQNSLYVGLKRQNKKIEMRGRINNPLKFKTILAEKQIVQMQKLLLEMSISVIKEILTTDSNYIDDFINFDFYNDLKNKWQITDKNFLKRMGALEVL